MSQSLHNILLVSASTETADRLFDLCELCDQPDLRIIVSRSIEDAISTLEHNSVSLAILDLANGVDCQFLDHVATLLNPMPVVALIADHDSQTIISTLRAGADDVFALSDLVEDAASFIISMKRQLRRALYIDEARTLRESLERSLDELREDHHAAQQVQQNILPPQEQILNGVRFEYTLTPSLLLSGDFVDAVEINDHQVLFYLADISGHGASSALVTVLLKNMTYRLLRNYRRNSSFDILSPLATLSRINQELLLSRMGKHLTIFAGIIDTHDSTLTYAVGGHHPMPILLQNGRAQFLEGRGMPVGLFDDPVFEQRSLVLPEQFVLTLFSDGVFEVLPGQSLADKEALLLATLEQGCVSSTDLTQNLIKETAAHPDDVAIMTVSRA